MSTTVAQARSKRRQYPPSLSRPPGRAKPAAPGSRAKVRPRRSCLTLTRALDQRGGAEAFKDIDQQDFAAAGLHHLVTDNPVAGIIAALCQHAWLDPGNQIDRRIFF